MATPNGAKDNEVDLEALLNASKDWADPDDDEAESETDFEDINRMLEIPATAAGQADAGRLEEAVASANIQEPSNVSDSEESGDDRGDEEEEENTHRRNKRRIRPQPPGLNIFNGAFLANFSASELNLEEHFEYNKRGRLRQLGVSEEDIEEMMSDVDVFLTHLAPTFKSFLLENQQDFTKICDYLFYYCSSCTDEYLHESAKRALFDLLRNYTYAWKLNLEHIVTALANLGAEMKLLTNESSIMEILSNRINRLASRRPGKGAYQFKLPKVKKSLVSLTERKGICASDLDRLGCMKMFVSLVSDILSGCDTNRSVFRPSSDDWTAQLVLLYIFQYVSVDKALTKDSFCAQSIKVLFHSQFESFSAFQWCGEERHRRPEKAVDRDSTNDVENNACIDISEVLADSLGSEAAELDVRTWTDQDLPPLDHMKGIDHHHNMVRRLQMLPFTSRGNQVKKNVAFLQLQQIINTENIQSFTSTDVTVYNKFILDSVAYRAKFNAFKDEHYVMLNLVRLVDMIVGSEASDCQGTKMKAIAQVVGHMKECDRRIRSENCRTDGSRVKELINAVTSKWKLMKERCKSSKMIDKIEREISKVAVSDVKAT